jgi:hypothetical protein
MLGRYATILVVAAVVLLALLLQPFAFAARDTLPDPQRPIEVPKEWGRLVAIVPRADIAWASILFEAEDGTIRAQFVAMVPCPSGCVRVVRR